MTSHTTTQRLRRACIAASCILAAALSGCAVVSVASTAVGVAATGAGLAVDAAVGTAKVVGGAVSAVTPGTKDE